MVHTVLIKSKSQSEFVKIETRIEVTEDHIEELALKLFNDSELRDEGKSVWAELDSTIHD